MMFASKLLIALFATNALSFNMEVTVKSSLTFDEAAAKNRPVAKVVTLLKDMLKQMEKEQEEDEEIYDALACWCTTNDKEKSKQIADAEAHIEDLTTRIEELTALSARLNTEIKNLEEEIKENQEALDTATAIREKQLAEFQAEEKDLLESISALKGAVTVLSKHQDGVTGFLQMPQAHLSAVAATVQKAMQKHAELLKGVISPRERKVVSSFLQAPEDYFDAAPTFKQSYAPQSGEIFGILSQMKETFETNLATAQKEEMANQKAYEDLKAAKEAEIKAGKEQLASKKQELADTDEKLADAKEDLEDTNKDMAANMEFLAKLKEKCSMTDSEWEERQKTRMLEMEACSKALAVLSNDEAHDLFSSTFNPSLLQATKAMNSERRTNAYNYLQAAAKKLNSPRLSTLAVRVRLDAFTKVKKAIDDMIAELLKQKEAEIKQKDFCVEEFNKNELETQKKTQDKKDTLALIDDLTMTIDQLTKAINKLKAEIGELQVQLKRAGEDREKENKDFQQTVADQRASQKLLNAALNVLKGFYDKKAAAALMQQEPAGPPPPPGFGEYKKNAAAGGVMSMIQQIINDAKAMEAEAIKAEEDAQKAYEDFVKETNNSIETKSRDIVNKSETKAKTEQELVEAEALRDELLTELEQLADYKAELHSSCDYVLKNFDVRQTARDEEVEALKQAKAILSGSKFEAFLQHA